MTIVLKRCICLDAIAFYLLRDGLSWKDWLGSGSFRHKRSTRATKAGDQSRQNLDCILETLLTIWGTLTDSFSKKAVSL